MTRRDSDLYHEFEGGRGQRCAIKTCQQGASARVHRKPKDLPEVRLVVAEAEVKKLRAGFRLLAERVCMQEEILYEMEAIVGLTMAEGWGKVDAGKKEIRKKLEAIAKKFAPKPKG